jgi:ribonuclease P protein component
LIPQPVLDSRAAPPELETAAQRQHLARAFLMTSASKPAQRQSLANSRLRKHADYVRAYAAGRKRQSSAMSWFLAPQTIQGAVAPASARVGLTVGKVIGKAHERNRIKRRMREALRRHVDLLPVGFDLILHPRRIVLTMEFAQLEREILRILEQAGVEAARSAKHSATSAMALGPHAS